MVADDQRPAPRRQVVPVVLVVGSCVDPRGPVALPGAWQVVQIDNDGSAPWRLGDTATLHADGANVVGAPCAVEEPCADDEP